MNRVIEILRRRLSGSPPDVGRTGAASPDPGNVRADRILELRADVSRLQQERLKLSEASAQGAAGMPRSDMASIERRLEEAQRELAKLQARI